MQHRIVMAFVGADRPGLVDRISAVVAEHDGNWQESRLSRLAGQFAGIVEVGVPPERATALAAGLEGLAGDGLSVVCTECDATPPADTRIQLVNVLGNDRRGIVHDVSHALAEQGINVTEMSSTVFAAPMSGETMFCAEAVLSVPETTNLAQLHEVLDVISHRLAVEIDLGDEDG